MARVVVSATCRASDLPAVCVVSGETEGVTGESLVLSPGGWGLAWYAAPLLLIGVVPYEKKPPVTVELPLSEAGRQRLNRFTLIQLACHAPVVVGGLAVWVGVLAQSPLRAGPVLAFVLGLLCAFALVQALTDALIRRRFQPLLSAQIEEWLELEIPSVIAAREIAAHTSEWPSTAAEARAVVDARTEAVRSQLVAEGKLPWSPGAASGESASLVPAHLVPERCPSCGGALVEEGEEPEALAACFHCGESLPEPE